jgi:pantoate--beta-alanine ligase
MPIIREPDGLAMSSRNAYLAPEERRRALALSKGLFAARELHVKGERDSPVLIARVRSELVSVEAREDYVELVDVQTLRAVEQAGRGTRLLVACYLGKTRLIDNIALG